jgi:hypothetical protein
MHAQEVMNVSRDGGENKAGCTYILVRLTFSLHLPDKTTSLTDGTKEMGRAPRGVRLDVALVSRELPAVSTSLIVVTRRRMMIAAFDLECSAQYLEQGGGETMNNEEVMYVQTSTCTR